MTKGTKEAQEWGRKMARIRKRKAAARRRRKEAEKAERMARMGIDLTPVEQRFQALPPFGGLGLDGFIRARQKVLAPEVQEAE